MEKRPLAAQHILKIYDSNHLLTQKKTQTF